MNSQSISPWYLDKGLYVMALNFILPLLSAKLGWTISADKVAAFAVASVAFILAHKAKSWSILKTELEAVALAKAKLVVGEQPINTLGLITQVTK